MTLVYLVFFLYLYRDTKELRPADVAVLLAPSFLLGAFDIYAWYQFIFVSRMP